MEYAFHIYFTSFHCTGRHELNKLTSLPMCGFTAQLVEHRTGIAEVKGSNPVEALIFSRLLPSNCLTWKFTAMVTLHFRLQPQYNIYFRSKFTLSLHVNLFNQLLLWIIFFATTRRKSRQAPKKGLWFDMPGSCCGRISCRIHPLQLFISNTISSVIVMSNLQIFSRVYYPWLLVWWKAWVHLKFSPLIVADSGIGIYLL